MYQIAQSPRILAIEKTWQSSLKDLLHQWHWKENLKHKEIGERLNLPRSTITRWFHQLDIPTQSCTRFTNLNLLNTGHRKTPPAKQKIKKISPYAINYDFFGTWTENLAYILGFFCADGSMYKNPRGSCYITFEITDKELLQDFNQLLGTCYKLALRLRPSRSESRQPSWRIQLGSKKLYNHFLTLGITPQKAMRIRIPDVPNVYIADFIRGYFDGDGGVWFGHTHKDREHPSKTLQTAFTSSSEGMLKDIASALYKFGQITLKKPYYSGHAFRLQYSTSDSRKIYQFMYNSSTRLFLERKKVIFEQHMGT